MGGLTKGSVAPGPICRRIERWPHMSVWSEVRDWLNGTSVPRQPEPPVNVQVIKSNGKIIPIETIFIGVTPKGQRVWRSSQPVDFRPSQGDQISCRVLPGRTSIEIISVQPDDHRS